MATPRLGLNLPSGTDFVFRQVWIDNWNALELNAASVQDLNDHKNAAVLDHPDNSVTDAKIGARILDADGEPAPADATGLSGLLSTWIARLLNRVVSITGEADYRTAPRTTLKNAVKLDGDTMTGNLIAPRLISNVADGTAPLQVTSKTLVTNLNADFLRGLATSAGATANTIAVRDANGALLAASGTQIGSGVGTAGGDGTSAMGLFIGGNLNAATTFTKNGAHISMNGSGGGSEMNFTSYASPDTRDGSAFSFRTLTGTASPWGISPILFGISRSGKVTTKNNILDNGTNGDATFGFITSRSGGINVEAGSDINLNASAANPTDPGDIVFRNYAKEEIGRFWYSSGEFLLRYGQTSPALSVWAGGGWSLTGNGYMKLPKGPGFLIQWMIVTLPATPGTGATYNFPIAFPTTVVGVYCTNNNSSAQYISEYNETLTGVNLISSGAGTARVLAIGW